MAKLKKRKKMNAQTGGLKIKEFAPILDMEGQYVHSFICMYCGLHFLVFSWVKDRHTTSNTYCPECGRRGRYLHLRKDIEDLEFPRSFIFGHVPFPESEVMPDTKIF